MKFADGDGIVNQIFGPFRSLSLLVALLAVAVPAFADHEDLKDVLCQYIVENQPVQLQTDGSDPTLSCRAEIQIQPSGRPDELMIYIPNQRNVGPCFVLVQPSSDGSKTADVDWEYCQSTGPKPVVGVSN